MEQMPDVLGMRLEEAEKVLHDAGVSYHIQKTSPPGRHRYPFTHFRVIRQRTAGDGQELLVCEV